MSWVDVITPPAVFLMMVVVGFDLSVDAFRRVLRFPKAAIVGTLGQISLLPAFATSLAIALELKPTVAGGLILLAACPGGGLSNVFAQVARSSLALSVTLTAVASVLAAVSLPMILAVGFPLLLSGGVVIELPLGLLTAQLAAIVVAPIAVGMSIRSRWPGWVEQNRRRFARTSMLAVAVVVVLAFGSELQEVQIAIGDSLLPAVMFTGGAMLLGYLVGLGLGLGAADRMTLLIEYATRNIGIAALVSLSILDEVEFLAIPTAAMMVGYPITLSIALLNRRFAPQPSEGGTS